MDLNIKSIEDIPYTISYVIRKRQQVDSLSELGSEKRPPDEVLWHNNPDKLNEWLDKVLGRKEKKEKDEFVLNIPSFEVEG